MMVGRADRDRPPEPGVSMPPGAGASADGRVKRRPLRIVAVIVLLGASVGGVSAYRAHKKAQADTATARAAADRPVPVAVASIARQDIPMVLDGLGTVTPLQTVTVKSQVDGRLDRL